MLLFKRILNFKQATLARLRDKRKAPRYPVGPSFPLKGSVNLLGIESLAKAGSAAVGSGRDWAGALANLSSSGASLMLPPAAITVRCEKTILRLTLEKHVLEIPCVVAHFRVFTGHSICGLSLEFKDFTVQKGFLQLLEAVRIGAAFAPMKPPAFQRAPAGMMLENYKADPKSRLTVWRKADGRQIDSFELVIGDHCLRGEAEGLTLEVYARQAATKSGKTARSEPAYNLSADVTDEVRQLFRWVVPNLTKALPNDLRNFMQRVLTETRTPAEREAARNLASPKSFPAPKTRPPMPRV